MADPAAKIVFVTGYDGELCAAALVAAACDYTPKHNSPDLVHVVERMCTGAGRGGMKL